MKFIGKHSEFLELTNLSSNTIEEVNNIPESGLQLIWFGKGNHKLMIDAVEFEFKENEILFLTEFHRLNVLELGEAKVLRFNRAFFCILDHDSEVGCRGLLFFGASQVPIIRLSEIDRERFILLWNAFVAELETEDVLQQEMLQMMLKRVMILCTRLYKEQTDLSKIDASSSDLVREFNFLVEKHFREKHAVKEYAELLFKSPKTLSNLFAKLSDKTPLQYIQERILLEARRLLAYTDKPVKEIAYDLGYDDVQSFSRFFRSQEGKSPTEFRAM
jgi:AraC-like DNA-binding protein